MLIKTAVNARTPMRRATIRKPENSRWWRGGGDIGTLCTHGGNVKWDGPVEKSTVVFSTTTENTQARRKGICNIQNLAKLEKIHMLSYQRVGERDKKIFK